MGSTATENGGGGSCVNACSRVGYGFRLQTKEQTLDPLCGRCVVYFIFYLYLLSFSFYFFFFFFCFLFFFCKINKKKNAWRYLSASRREVFRRQQNKKKTHPGVADDPKIAENSRK